MREMTDSERKTATLLEPLTMDRRDDRTFDPGSITRIGYTQTRYVK